MQNTAILRQGLRRGKAKIVLLCAPRQSLLKQLQGEKKLICKFLYRKNGKVIFKKGQRRTLPFLLAFFDCKRKARKNSGLWRAISALCVFFFKSQPFLGADFGRSACSGGAFHRNAAQHKCLRLLLTYSKHIHDVSHIFGICLVLLCLSWQLCNASQKLRQRKTKPKLLR